jgi:hypothetical protein
MVRATARALMARVTARALMARVTARALMARVTARALVVEPGSAHLRGLAVSESAPESVPAAWE